MADQTEKKKGAKTGAPESEKNPDTTTAASSGAKSAAAAPERCQVAKCKQAVRAKGYCRKHYLGWRRGDVGKKHRYKICSKEACRKPAVLGGKCEEHKRGAPAAEAASA